MSAEVLILANKIVFQIAPLNAKHRKNYVILGGLVNNTRKKMTIKHFSFKKLQNKKKLSAFYCRFVMCFFCYFLNLAITPCRIPITEMSTNITFKGLDKHVCTEPTEILTAPCLQESSVVCVWGFNTVS